jgi:hypothetical protein
LPFPQQHLKEIGGFSHSENLVVNEISFSEKNIFDKIATFATVRL